MTLFLLAAVPLTALTVVLLPWPSERVPRRPWLANVYLRGVLFALPAWAIFALVHRLLDGLLIGAPLYFRTLAADHLVPVVLGAGAFVLAQRRLEWHPSEDGILLVALCFLGGFFSLIDLADYLRRWRDWDAHLLFLLPMMRVAFVLAAAMAAPRFYRWEGTLGLLYVGLCAAASPVLALASFLWAANFWAAGWVLAPLILVAALGAFVLRVPHALRG